MADFNVGDKVRLNSGNPDLTVIKIIEDEQSKNVTVQFDDGKDVQRFTLPQACVKPIQ